MLFGGKKYVFITVLVLSVFLECSILAYFFYPLYVRNTIGKNTLGTDTVVPIRKEYLISSLSAELKYFYEPQANVVREDQASWLPYKAVNTMNADRLNERYNYTVEKPSNVFRIITLGDSLTFGLYVSTADNWTEQLEDMLNASCRTKDIQKIEVINLGMTGYDVQYIAHRYEIRGAKYQPDLILWLESGSGFSRLRELNVPLIQKYAKEEKNVELVWSKANEEIHRRYSPEQIYEQVHAAWQDFFHIRGSTKVIISTFSTIDPQDKAKLTLWTRGEPNVNLNFGIRDITVNDGVLPYGSPNHYGHKMIAEDTLTYLKNNGIVTCGK